MGKNKIKNYTSDPVRKDVMFFVFFNAIFVSIFCVTLAFRQNAAMTELFKTMFFVGILYIIAFIIYPFVNKTFIKDLRLINFLMLMSMMLVVVISLGLFAFV